VQKYIDAEQRARDQIVDPPARNTAERAGQISAAVAAVVVTVVAQSAGNSRGGFWTSTRSQTPVQNAFRHFKDHGKEFGSQNAVQYAKSAKQFLQSPPSGTLSRTRPNGDVVRYDPASNTFGVMDASGTPRTMFKPSTAEHGYPTNLDYFLNSR